MSKKKITRREAYKSSASPFSFLRRPVVQLGIVAVIAVIVIIIALTSGGQTSGLAATISTEDAYKLYQQGDTFFLDVREPSEWAEYHAPNTTLIPLGELAARVNEVPKDKKIVVVCRSGNRSDQGRDILKQAGFTDVTSMDGGLKTWRDLGYPIEP